MGLITVHEGPGQWQFAVAWVPAGGEDDDVCTHDIMKFRLGGEKRWVKCKFHGAIKSDEPMTLPWEIVVTPLDLPKGYYPPGRVTIYWNPIKRKPGRVELELVSPCHKARLSTDVIPATGRWMNVQRCTECRKVVIRQHPEFPRVEEWFDRLGDISVWDPRRLEPLIRL